MAHHGKARTGQEAHRPADKNIQKAGDAVVARKYRACRLLHFSIRGGHVANAWLRLPTQK